jgi:hypothetical protein
MQHGQGLFPRAKGQGQRAAREGVCHRVILEVLDVLEDAIFHVFPSVAHRQLVDSRWRLTDGGWRLVGRKRNGMGWRAQQMFYFTENVLGWQHERGGPASWQVTTA